MTTHASGRGNVFGLIWITQLVSLIGSGLTSFALGVWVYQTTGSATQFALIAFFATLPGLLLLPLAGALADRYDRRVLMLLSDAGAGLTTLALIGLLATDQLAIWHIYLLTTLSSTASAFQWPAYTAATTLLVPPEQYGRASGMIQAARALAQLVAPLFAGLLLGAVGLIGVIAIDVVSFSIALLTLATVRFPAVPRSNEGQAAGVGGAMRDGVVYILRRRGLLALLLFFTVGNLLAGIVQVLLTPLVLRFSTAAVLGTVMAAGGVGMLVGGSLLGAWGGPGRKIVGVFAGALLIGTGMVVIGAQPSAWSVGAGLFTAMLGVPIIGGCTQAIMQRKVALDVQGRVLAIGYALAGLSQPVAYLAAGPLADQVFEPLLVASGPLASTVGALIGTGAGRGIGLLCIVVGLVSLAITVISVSYRPLRQLEADLPDAIGDEPEIAFEQRAASLSA